MQPTSLSGRLGEHIVREKEAHDLSRNPEFGSFQFLGYRTSAVAVELVALCDADGLTEGDIVRRRDEFFELVRKLPHDYGLKPRGRNPNGLLGFVFAEGCPEPMARFIARQTRISHAAGTGGVAVAWAIDVPNRRIHTHDNPVSIFPPVVIVARQVYPGLEYLQSILPHLAVPPESTRQTSTTMPPLQKKTFEEFTRMGERPSGNEPPAIDSPPANPPAQARDGTAHILFVAASTGPRLDLEREFERIETSLRMAKVRDRVVLKQVWAASIDRLMQAMLDESPTIVHFSGHGEKVGIVLRDQEDGEHVVSGAALGSLFALFRETVQCVVLNSCWSEPQAQAIHQQVPRVIGMRAKIGDDTGIAFSTGFYKAIAAGKDVDFAFRAGRALVQAEGHGDEDLLVLL
jgi:hypothetical protein